MAVMTPPAIAEKATANPLPENKIICSKAPVAAPEVKPMMSGEPSGLREID
ncbi:Uncharacterised protein [Vibrio cholerae]|uniref:Uncharacterized protein n=1 Tax=Vibrio cholerae TaxID=666 RepID=A0A655XSC3_VIBCL|nr:Uncharacterised protein [Vibrio cholerae]